MVMRKTRTPMTMVAVELVDLPARARPPAGPQEYLAARRSGGTDTPRQAAGH